MDSREAATRKRCSAASCSSKVWGGWLGGAGLSSAPNLTAQIVSQTLVQVRAAAGPKKYNSLRLQVEITAASQPSCTRIAAINAATSSAEKARRSRSFSDVFLWLKEKAMSLFAVLMEGGGSSP